jgi:tetratricopeptide (TPR) repeat protein
MPGSVLARGKQLYRKHRFSRVIALLEPEVFQYRESHEYYSLLGFSCLHTGDFGGAYSYLKRADQLRPGDVDVRLGIAAVHLKRNETSEALRLWLEVLEKDPTNKKAKRGLDVVRRAESPESLYAFLESGGLQKVLPSPPFRVPTAVPVLAALLMIGGLAAITYPRWRPLLERSPPVTRPGLADITLPEEAKSLTDYEGVYHYVLSERELQRAFKRAKAFLADYQDNLARRELNRILYSNAAAAVKERAMLLVDYVQEPTFATMRDGFTYESVVEDPLLHDGCYVRWRGKATNVVVTAERITFDLLVGYEDERVLKGVVPVYLRFAARLDPEFSVDLLGQVEATETDFVLRGVSVHQIR